MPRASVLVFTPLCPDSVGEQVVQIPFLHFLRATHPDAEIVGVAPERSGGVLGALGLFDTLLSDSSRESLSKLGGLVRALRGRRFEIVYQLRKKSLRAALLARAATPAPIHGFRHGVNRVIQSRSTPFALDRYIAESYASLLGRSTQEYADALVRPRGAYALFIPGGRTRIKCYPLEQYVEAARALEGTLPVRFLLGPDREEERRVLEASLPPGTVDFGPPLPEVARLVQEAALVIANDCGPAHFAHIADVPRISLFDRSIDAGHWFFPGSRGRLLRSPGKGRIAEIPVAEILRHAHELLAAR